MSHLTVTNCLWWGYLTVFIDFLTGGRGAPIYWLYGYVTSWKGYGFQAIYSGIGSSNHRKLV